jgi:hypothetical protein
MQAADRSATRAPQRRFPRLPLACVAGVSAGMSQKWDTAVPAANRRTRRTA